MSTQDLGQYNAAVRQNGLRLNANEPLVVAGAVTLTQTPATASASALAASGGGALDPTLSSFFTITPTASETLTASSAPVGGVVHIKVLTSGTSSYTLTFGTGFVSTGTLATGTVSAKTFIVTFVGDGTNLIEVSRTTAM